MCVLCTGVLCTKTAGVLPSHATHNLWRLSSPTYHSNQGTYNLGACPSSFLCYGPRSNTASSHNGIQGDLTNVSSHLRQHVKTGTYRDPLFVPSCHTYCCAVVLITFFAYDLPMDHASGPAAPCTALDDAGSVLIGCRLCLQTILCLALLTSAAS